MLRDRKRVYNVLGYMQANRPFFLFCCGLNKSLFIWVVVWCGYSFCSQMNFMQKIANTKKRRMKKWMCETLCSFNPIHRFAHSLGDKSFNINLHALKPICCCCLNMLVLNFISRILFVNIKNTTPPMNV